MGLPIVCPVCGSSYPAEAGLADAEARKALAAALDLPAPLASQVIPYLGLHAPAKKRLAWPKLTRLVSELTALVTSGQVTRDRETRPAPLQSWADGLTEVLAMRDKGKLDLPLEGHGLLCEIVHRAARKAGATQEAATRPLHPSHRPVQPREGWERSKETGAKHVGALLGALKPTQPDQTQSDQTKED